MMRPTGSDVWPSIALVGGMAITASVSVIVLLVSLGVAAVTVLVHAIAQRRTQAPLIRHGGASKLLRRVTATVASVWALTLVAGLATASVAYAIVVLALAGIVAVVLRLLRADEDRTESADSPELAKAITRASDAQLADLWRRSADVLAHSHHPAATMRYVEIRRLILDEAERRAPDLLTTWLTEDPRADNLPDTRR